MQEDRREFRRQEVRYPMECCSAGDGRGYNLRAVTRNISTGGVAFEVDVLEGMVLPEPHALLDVELAIPPGEGHSPYQGSIRSVAEVLRCEPLPSPRPQGGEGRERVRIAARFREPLKLQF